MMNIFNEYNSNSNESQLKSKFANKIGHLILVDRSKAKLLNFYKKK